MGACHAPLIGPAPAGRGPRALRGWPWVLLAAATLIALALLAGGPAESTLELLAPRDPLAAMRTRWLAEARAARAAGRARQARLLAVQRRRKLAKLALIPRAAGSPAASRAATEEGQEFNAWTVAWHNTHPGASLAKERAAWHARQDELQKIAAWEARQERRESTKAASVRGAAAATTVRPARARSKTPAEENLDVREAPAATATAAAEEEGSQRPQKDADEAGVSSEADRATRQDDPAAAKEFEVQWEETPAAREERVEEGMENGIRANLAEEHGEEDEDGELGVSPQERVARARRLIADSYLDEDPCTPATFWFDNTIDPRPRCAKRPYVLDNETPKAAPGFEPFEGEEAQGGRVAEPTVLGVPDGPPDFNGADAVIAHHPFIGWQPTDLEERGGETRGSFSVVSAPSGFDDEGEVQLAIYGPPKTPIGCKIRGYRKLSGDFQGNVVSTGFLQAFSSAEGEIQTGPISPGVANEYDILTCRDQETGEVQHFRLSWGSKGFNDMRGHGPVRVLGTHTGMNTDSVTFDMDRPTFEDQRAIDDYYNLNYDPASDDKPFSSGRLE